MSPLSFRMSWNGSSLLQRCGSGARDFIRRTHWRSLSSTSVLPKRSLLETDVGDKNVLIRVDFNVPLDKSSGEITNDQRIQAALPTIELALEKGARRVVLMSHLGRPKGRRNPKLSLAPIARRLESLMNRKVTFVSECVGKDVQGCIENASKGSVFLLENLRFHAEEEGKGEDDLGNKVKADPKAVTNFRHQLTLLGDVYVNDAFGAAHRAHSSIVGIELPFRVSGLLLQKELQYLGNVSGFFVCIAVTDLTFQAVDNPARPFVTILGGAKVSDKIQLIDNLLDKVDGMVIGGGMAFTFKHVLHRTQIGKSLFDQEGAKLVSGIMQKADSKGVKIHLPTDFVCAPDINNFAEVKTVSDSEGVPSGWIGLDIGPESSKSFGDVVRSAKTVVWNGPMGMFEHDEFAQGSKAVLDSVVQATQAKNCLSIIGGGDTATLFKKYDSESKVSHVSTGGGASLEFLEGKVLPGVATLSDRA